MNTLFKKFSLLALLMIALCANLKADIIELGDPASTTYNGYGPMYNFYHDSKSYLLYTKAEINVAGINSGGFVRQIQFYVATVGEITQGVAGPMIYTGFTIKMQNSNLTAVSAEVTAGWNQVFTGDVSLVGFPAPGWITINLTTPFYWDGNSNLLVQTCFDNAGYGTSSTLKTTPATSMMYVKYEDGAAGCGDTPLNNTQSPTYRTNIKLDIDNKPAIVKVLPEAEPVVAYTSGTKAGGLSDLGNQPGIVFRRRADHDPITLSYKIEGPLGNSSLVYTAHVPGSPGVEDIPVPADQIGEAVTFRFSAAKYQIANQAPTNDGSFDFTSILVKPGEYTITATIKTPADPTYVRTATKRMFISLQNDIALTEIINPKSRDLKMYPEGIIPLQCNVTNVGVMAIDSFLVYARIYKNGVLKAVRTYRWDANPADPDTKFKISQSMSISAFDVFNTYGEIGDFSIQYEVVLLNGADLELANNILPVAGAPVHYFRVAHEREPKADLIIQPTGVQYKGRPVRPEAQYSNNGLSDMSNVPVRMIIKDPNGVEVYNKTSILEDIPSGIYNTSKALFELFTPQVYGTYTVTASVEFPNDPDMTNNTFSSSFTIGQPLNGTYTIGLLNNGGARNFKSIQIALDALFLAGINAPVVFELTDTEYNEGNAGLAQPALDFRSTINGVDATNTITFKPSNLRSIVKGGVKINLASGNGIGMMFGQSVNPNNPNATVNYVTPLVKKQYANSKGYITFDGGVQKAILLAIKTDSPQRNVVSLKNATNITVKNCILQDGLNQSASWACHIPSGRYNTVFNRIEFEPDYEISTNRYLSSAIVIRSLPDINPNSYSNDYNIDTINSVNNKFMNNEISNFGYGITSIGTGYLTYQSPTFTGFKEYYNGNNTFEGNKIYNIGTYGIFLGNEISSVIKGNRIYNVAGYCGTDAAGIALGSPSAIDGNWNFVTVGINVTGNEISNVNSANNVYGIKAEQNPVAMNDPGIGLVIFPKETENFKFINNLIWGLVPADGMTNRWGIRVFTPSTNSADPLGASAFASRMIKNTLVANNTIVMDGDNGVINTSIIAGVALQQTTGNKFYNNAIAVLDQDISGDCLAATPLLIKGYTVKKGGFISNRNVYWMPNNTQVEAFRYIEVNSNGDMLDYGTRDDYRSLNQFMNWTGNETQSKVSNFTTDMEYVGTNPPSLKIKSNPMPISSVLNNRGLKLTDVTEDINGVTRGGSNQRYDIGAYEFSGRFYSNDLELMAIHYPGTWRSLVGTYRDAEYYMTSAPVDIKARIRNNGTSHQTGALVTVKVYREMPTDAPYSSFVGTKVFEKTVPVTVASTEDTLVSFGLADQGGLGDDWIPQTYSDLKGANYNVPAQFSSMKPNVTPRYRVEVSFPSNQDEAPSNNTAEKYLRFYIQRSNLSMVVSAENSHIPVSVWDNVELKMVPKTDVTNLDVVAGKLNVDSVFAGFKRLGWVTDYDSEKPRYDIDLFERNGWEIRNVDYSMYRTVIWSDASDKALTRFQYENVYDYLTSYKGGDKKNFIAASQEFVRSNIAIYPDLLKNIMRADYNAPGNPMGAGVDNDGNTIKGEAIARNISTSIIKTGWQHATAIDNSSFAGLMKIHPLVIGNARVAYRYNTSVNNLPDDKIMGIATTTLTQNMILFGVDWRHFGNIESVLRGTVDYVENNDGHIVPVELYTFDADQVGSRVELNWTTASERKSSRFDVERASANESGISSFAKIDEVKAAGESSTISAYGPIIDNKVEFGKSYVYRLKMIDNDGEFTYSDEKTVTMTGEYGNISMGEVAPNPVNANASFKVNAASDISAKIGVYDINGKLVMNIFDGKLSVGETSMSVNVAALLNGNYMIVLNSGDIVIRRALTVVK